MTRIAINGLGLIGRASLKIIIENPYLDIIAVNDIAPIENIAYLLKYDSVHGTYENEIKTTENKLVVGNQEIPYYNEKNPEKLPWKTLDIDVVIESTGIFTKEEDAKKHISAGAKTVILSGPTNSANVPTIVHGVNNKNGDTSIFSCASCTTNNISPIIEILGRRLGIKKAIMTTIHANTASNKTVDLPSSNLRMGRSGINNLIPTTTGAATATTKVLTQYDGKFDGLAIRVPVAVGSISDITILSKTKTSIENVNTILEEEARSFRYKDVLRVTYEPIVSSDIIRDTHASIADLSMTKVVDGDLIKILTWYDNEWGFANQMIRQIQEMK